MSDLLLNLWTDPVPRQWSDPALGLSLQPALLLLPICKALRASCLHGHCWLFSPLTRLFPPETLPLAPFLLLKFIQEGSGPGDSRHAWEGGLLLESRMLLNIPQCTGLSHKTSQPQTSAVPRLENRPLTAEACFIYDWSFFSPGFTRDTVLSTVTHFQPPGTWPLREAQHSCTASTAAALHAPGCELVLPGTLRLLRRRCLPTAVALAGPLLGPRHTQVCPDSACVSQLFSSSSSSLFSCVYVVV